MGVPAWVWSAMVVGLIVILLIDLLVVDRGKPTEFTRPQAGRWVGVYLALALLFGLGLLAFAGADRAGQFFAGYLTEYTLSIDNLFVFYVVMARFKVPKEYQHRVLLVGITAALVLRGLFIAAGAAALARFDWLLFLFGGFLCYVAVDVFRGRHRERETEDAPGGAVLRAVKRLVPTTAEYHAARLTARVDGRRVVTPMLLVMTVIGVSDVLFALDSIPAIFGFTRAAFIVFAANAFALMGLRQLYFLLSGLLQRLVYLNHALSAILGFIGVKLLLEAARTVGLAWAPTVPVWVSLAVVAVTMAVTVAASVVKEYRCRSAPSAPARPRRSTPKR